MDDWLYTAVPNIHCNSFYIVILLLLLWSSLFMRPLEEVMCWSFLCFSCFVVDRVFPFPIRGSGIEGVICRTDSKSLWNLSYLNKLDLRCMKQTNEVNLLVLLCSAMDLFVWSSYDNTNDSLLIDFLNGMFVMLCENCFQDGFLSLNASAEPWPYRLNFDLVILSESLRPTWHLIPQKWVLPFSFCFAIPIF